MTDWVRLWHDMPTDPKWRVIARKSGQPLPCVIAVFNLMMIAASQNADERGVMLAWDDEDAAAALDMEPEAIAAIRQAMQGKVLEGQRLSGWEKRQPKREDGTAAQRKAAWKEREAEKRNASERIGTHRNAPETDAETDIPFSNENGANENSDKQFWDNAKTYLADETKNPGAMIGKWVSQHTKQATAEAITRAQLERPVQKIPFIQGVLRQKARDPTKLAFGPC